MATFSLNSLIGYAFSNQTEQLTEKKPLSYIVGGNGVFEIRDTRLMRAVRKIGDSGIPKLPEMQEGIHLNVPQIPFSAFCRMVAFMKYIYEKFDTESTAMVFYNEAEKQFKIWIPLQENSGAASNYKRDEDPEYSKMCRENILVMVAHSHPWGPGGVVNSSPSPSGTDNNDEKEPLLYMIVGNVKGVPTTFCSTCPGAKRIALNFFDIFENPFAAEIAGIPDKFKNLLNKNVPLVDIMPMYYNIDGIEVPGAWLKRCTKKVVIPAKDWKDIGRAAAKINPKDDPVIQYYNKYGNGYAYGMEDYSSMDEESLERLYERQILGKSSGVSEGKPDLRDVIDDILDLSDKEIAQVILKLQAEGYEELIRCCMGDDAPKEKKEGSRK